MWVCDQTAGAVPFDGKLCLPIKSIRGTNASRVIAKYAPRGWNYTLYGVERGSGYEILMLNARINLFGRRKRVNGQLRFGRSSQKFDKVM